MIKHVMEEASSLKKKKKIFKENEWIGKQYSEIEASLQVYISQHLFHVE